MTVRDVLTALQALPRDAELLAFEAACEDYRKREIDEVEWQGGQVYLHLGARHNDPPRPSSPPMPNRRSLARPPRLGGPPCRWPPARPAAEVGVSARLVMEHPTQPSAAGPWAAPWRPESGGCGCGGAGKRLRAFSLDNVTAPDSGQGWGGPVALLWARRCWRTTSPTGEQPPVRRGARGWPADRAPRRAPLIGGARCARFDGRGRAHRACALCAVPCAVPGRTDRASGLPAQDHIQRLARYAE
jgi:hypothetical protein